MHGAEPSVHDANPPVVAAGDWVGGGVVLEPPPPLDGLELPEAMRVCWAVVLACSRSYFSSSSKYKRAERKVCGGCHAVIAGMV